MFRLYNTWLVLVTAQWPAGMESGHLFFVCFVWCMVLLLTWSELPCKLLSGCIHFVGDSLQFFFYQPAHQVVVLIELFSTLLVYRSMFRRQCGLRSGAAARLIFCVWVWVFHQDGVRSSCSKSTVVVECWQGSLTDLLPRPERTIVIFTEVCATLRFSCLLFLHLLLICFLFHFSL
eukprot:scpid106474/ scgid22458/ 